MVINSFQLSKRDSFKKNLKWCLTLVSTFLVFGRSVTTYLSVAAAAPHKMYIYSFGHHERYIQQNISIMMIYIWTYPKVASTRRHSKR